MRAWAPIPADLEDVSCAVCRGTTRERLLSHDWFGFPIGLVSCEGCGFVYCTPRPTAAFMDMFYRHHYLLFYEGWSELDEQYIRAHKLREAAHDRVARYRTLVPTGGQVLDVGCGAAFFLAELKRTRPDVTVQGIEPGRAQAHYARDLLNVPVLEASYSSFTAPGAYDLVTAFHIAEHVPDLNDFFRFLRRRVTEDGHVVIESPNLEGTWRDLSMFHIAHLYAFTAASLAQLGRKHGFDCAYVLTSDVGWDRPNLHVVLRPRLETTCWDPRRTPISEGTRRKLAGAVRSRYRCVVRSWAMLFLRYIGLGRWLDLWRLRRARHQ